MNISSISLIACVTLNTIASHAILKQGLKGLELPTSWMTLPTFLYAISLKPFIWISLTLQVIGYVGWIMIISRERLAEAVSISGAFFYIITAAVGWTIFQEELTRTQLMGLICISLGVYLMTNNAT